MGYLDIAKSCRRRKPRRRKQECHVVFVSRARAACLKAGRCLRRSGEQECDLVPLAGRWGWCREWTAGRDQDGDRARAEGRVGR